MIPYLSNLCYSWHIDMQKSFKKSRSLIMEYRMRLHDTYHFVHKMICVVKRNTLKHRRINICTLWSPYRSPRTYTVCRGSGKGTPQSCTSTVLEIESVFDSKNPTEVSLLPPLGLGLSSRLFSLPLSMDKPAISFVFSICKTLH